MELREYIENVIAKYEIMRVQYRKVPEYVMVCSKVIEEMQELLLWIDEMTIKSDILLIE